MRVGVGLPNVVPGVSRDDLVTWAHHAEEGPFTSVGVLHRVAYESHDPLDALALVAPETSRVGLVTMVAVAPLYDTERLAKESAAVDEASGGRLVLGLSVGARLEDYRAAGVEHRDRGRRFEEQLVALPDLWEQAGVRVPPVLVGGTADVAFARVARWAHGYVHGGGPPRAFATAARKAHAAWADFDRPGTPALWGQSYFVLGDQDEVARGRAYMRHYYGFTGPFVERIVEDLLTTPQQVAARVRGYAEAGCDELILLPALGHPEQVDRLATVVAG
jgi:alkanesulfonate monooxygenase SsuD/methylene tetrahydromethanopterin reductase-like flavin-dependent oxidoreductase (luciferase family)